LVAPIGLVIRGRELLATGKLLERIWGSLGKEFFINNLVYGNYKTENELLENLRRWAIYFNRSFHTIRNAAVSIDIGVFCTHQAYVRGVGERREFGDVTFVTVFSSTTDRTAYANTFQIKVDDFAENAYRGLFSHHFGQLEFYRRKLIIKLGKPDSLLCDFLYYWFIGLEMPHLIKETPLSLTWLPWNKSFNWPKYNLRPLDALLRCLFLITGIDVDFLLRRKLCTPRLEKILLQIVKEGVRKSLEKSFLNLNESGYDIRLRSVLENLDGNGPLKDPYREKPPEAGFESPEFPISSEIVIATEVSFKE